MAERVALRGDGRSVGGSHFPVHSALGEALMLGSDHRTRWVDTDLTPAGLELSAAFLWSPWLEQASEGRSE